MRVIHGARVDDPDLRRLKGRGTTSTPRLR